MSTQVTGALENEMKVEEWRKREEILKLERGGEELYRKFLGNIVRSSTKNKVTEEAKMNNLLVLLIPVFLCVGCAGLPHREGALYNSSLIKGQKHLVANQYKEAVEAFTKALELGKKTNKTMLPTVMLGETHVKGNELNVAKNIAEEAVAKWPKESCAWEILGKVNLKRSRLDEAESSFQKALELSKNKEEKERLNSLINLTKALRSYSQADMQSSKKFFNEIKDENLVKEVRVKTKEILKMDLKQ